MILKRPLFTVAAMSATVVAGLGSVTASPAGAARPTVDQVIRWNRTLLQIIRTPGAQPATVHPARNLAIMTSVKYTAALQEVQRQGEVHSAARAADQTQVANVWAAPIQNYWNEIAQTAALGFSAALREALSIPRCPPCSTSVSRTKRSPSTTPSTPSTSGSATATAIPADPIWTLLAGNIGPDPSYPGAHGTVIAAAAVILQSLCGTDCSSLFVKALPGVQRSVSGFSAAAREAGLSRIYAGQHTRLARDLRHRTGRDVAHCVLRNDLQLR